MPEIVRKTSEARGEAPVNSPFQLSEGSDPANTWISDFQPPEL